MPGAVLGTESTRVHHMSKVSAFGVGILEGQVAGEEAANNVTANNVMCKGRDKRRGAI